MQPSTKGPRSIVAGMVATVVAIGLLAYWDDQRESSAALADFAREQVTLATSLAGGLVESPGRVLVLESRGGALRTRDGRDVRSPTIEGAIAAGADSVRLSRPEAASLGLPERTALAGIAPAGATDTKHWVVVVASALRERDRERRAQWRLVLSVALSAAVVLSFGTLALRRQRARLELEAGLAVAEAVRERDARLVRADKLASLGALGIGIAHEVSTPLGVIVGRAEQIAPRVASDERATRAVTVILDQAARIGTVIRGMLDLARGGKASFVRVRPDAVVTDALDLVRHRFEKAGVSLRDDVAPGLPSIACDPKLFTQVLVNLLLNACEACQPDGAVQLRVGPGDERVVFAVVDDGHGIAPGDAARAVEPFFTTKASGGGTGLGLAIAREIVVHHGGELRLDGRSDGRRGTEASVSLAAVREEPS
ncbi:MAG: sensor histidine kinase [Polyangiaceae bacterium]